MVKLTRLTGESIIINEDNIQWIESLPDTTVTFIGGGRVLVKETPDEIRKLLETKEHSASECGSL